MNEACKQTNESLNPNQINLFVVQALRTLQKLVLKQNSLSLLSWLTDYAYLVNFLDNYKATKH